MIDNVHQANRILLSFMVRERAHHAHVFHKARPSWPRSWPSVTGHCNASTHNPGGTRQH